MHKISKRIKEIAKLIPPQRKIADVGCDHGYLVMEAFDNNLIDYALLIDNKEKPLLSAKMNLEEYDDKKYSLSLSSGAESITSNIECVCILGMGGILITDILSNKEKLKNVQKFILQPNKNSYEVRKFLMENGYKIINEKIIYDKKYYEVIVAVVGKAQYSELELLYGPINLKERTQNFKDYLKYKINLLKCTNSSNVLKKIKEMEDLL